MQLKVLYSNVDILSTTKLAELEHEINKNQPKIVCLTEILPKSNKYHFDIQNCQIEGFNLCINNLEKRGVAIYISEDLTSEQLILSTPFDEYTACRIEKRQPSDCFYIQEPHRHI